MAAMSTIIAGVGLALNVVGQMGQQDARDEQKKAAEQEAAARRQQAAAERRIADLKAVMASRAQVREARLKSANILNVGATTSPGGSSVTSGAGAVGTQLNANLGFASAVSSNNDISYAATGRIADANVLAAHAGGDFQDNATIAGIGNTIFNYGGGFKTIFGGAGGSSGNSGISNISFAQANNGG